MALSSGKTFWPMLHGWGLRVEQLDQHASEIVKAQVDVIYCTGDAAIRAAQQATKTIPILGLTDNMVGSGLVRSLAKPAGNTTGVSILAGELDGKRQEILMEAVPGARRMAVLADPNATSPQQFQALEEETHTRGVELLIYRVMKPEEIAGAIDTAKSSGASALNVLATPLLFNNRQIILPRAATLRLPTILQAPEGAEDGSLIAYGPRHAAARRKARRPTRRAADEIRVGDQSQNSQSYWRRCTIIAHAARRRRDRVGCEFVAPAQVSFWHQPAVVRDQPYARYGRELRTLRERAGAL
jgi:hypothetical protein